MADGTPRSVHRFEAWRKIAMPVETSSEMHSATNATHRGVP